MTLESATSALKERVPYLGLSLVAIVADRLTKYLVDARFPVGEGLTVLEGFFRLTYVRNTGVAFGLFSSGDPTARMYLFSGFALAAAVIVSVYSVRNPVHMRRLQIALALIFAGAIGNLYDRIAYGYVVDFLEFHVGNYYWPTFNVADTAISIGVGLLALEIIQDEIRSRA